MNPTVHATIRLKFGAFLFFFISSLQIVLKYTIQWKLRFASQNMTFESLRVSTEKVMPFIFVFFCIFYKKRGNLQIAKLNRSGAVWETLFLKEKEKDKTGKLNVVDLTLFHLPKCI